MWDDREFVLKQVAQDRSWDSKRQKDTRDRRQIDDDDDNKRHLCECYIQQAVANKKQHIRGILYT